MGRRKGRIMFRLLSASQGKIRIRVSLMKLSVAGEHANCIYVVIDEAGKPSLVFDCVYNPALKSRSTKDENFRLYIIGTCLRFLLYNVKCLSTTLTQPFIHPELALEHVESKISVYLSRQIGTPNIASKGKLESRTVLIPNRMLYKAGSKEADAAKVQAKKPLIEEIPARRTDPGTNTADKVKAVEPEKEKVKTSEKPKSILKSTSSTSLAEKATAKRPLIEDITMEPAASREAKKTKEGSEGPLPPPRWKWRKDEDRIVIIIDVPKLVSRRFSEHPKLIANL